MASSKALQKSGISSLAPFLLFGSLIAAAVLYFNAQNPAFFNELKYKALGASPIATKNDANANELARLQKIDALIISTRNKTDLREGRPFWGAASHMVDLAFKAPADEVGIQTSGARVYEFHRFGFGGNREPVVMEYANNVLACAHYPQRKKTLCSPGSRSIYDGQTFPFTYEISINQ